MNTCMNAVKDFLEAKYFERTEIIEGCLVALGAKQHILLLGPPGTGKSEMIADLTGCFDGAKHFSWLMSRLTTPEELYGPVSLKALENDSYERITTGKMPEAHIAFLDETFKSSSTIANTNLSLMDNRRIFFNGKTPVQTPLMSVFGASNELPEGDEEQGLSAFNDRFSLRYELDYIQDPSRFKGLVRRSLGMDTIPDSPSVSLEDLMEFQNAVAAIRVTSEIIEAVTEIRIALNKEGVTPSDRRFNQSFKLLQSVAALNGCDEVFEDHLSILANCYWTAPEEKNIVKKIIRELINPVALHLDELIEEAQELLDNVLNKDDAASATETMPKLKNIQKELNELCNTKVKNKNLAEDYKNRFNNIQKTMITEGLGIDPAFMEGLV